MGPRKSKKSVNNSSRRRPQKKNTPVESPVDRISALPDSILGVILSLLPTNNAVATSTLSKRWKSVWKTVRNLDFCHAADWDLSTEEVEEVNKKFIGFVNHVLLNHDAGILNKFHLVWTPCIQSHATSWIKTATTKNVRELSLNLQSYNEDEDEDEPSVITMPISIFSCESLQSLKLNGDICLSAATVFCLPKLERLDLDGVTFESVEAFEEFIKGCPVLYYLIVKMTGEDRDDSDFTYIISSTSLRILELNLGAGRGAPRQLKLDASSLEHLKIYSRGIVSTDFVLNNLASLVEAKIDIFMSNFRAGSFTSVVDAVTALDRAKILSLSCDVMRVLSCASIKLSANFKRLVKLETGTYCCHWGSLQDLIQSSNNLEVLTIHRLYKYASEHDHSNWITPVEVPKCLSTSLKKVVIDGYTGQEDEREMIGYMLEHGRVLEDMQITCCMSKHDKQDELLEEIRVYPIKSPACNIKFCGWTSTRNV